MAIWTRARSALARLLSIRQPGGVPWGAQEPTGAGILISEDSSMRFAAVHACVRVLSEDIAALPLFVYRRLPSGGKERAREHPLYEILHDKPNREMTAIAFKTALMVNLLLQGNAYAFVEYDQAGRVIGLWPLLSSEVTPARESDGTIVYKVGGETLAAYEVLHIPGLSYDGLVGMSPISYMRESIALGMAAEQFGSTFFKNGTHMGGVIEVDQYMADEAFERTRAEFQSMYRGLQNAHAIPVLEAGSHYKPVGIAPEDAQFLETRKYQRAEIAAMFRVPLHLIGDLERATFSNIEHQDLAYLQRTLLPWLVRIEQSAQGRLLLPSERKEFLIEHDTGNFLRGDTISRMSAYSVAINAGILTRNEARERENLNPVSGGDELLQPLNMQPAGEDFNTRGERRAARNGESAAKARVRLAEKAGAEMAPAMAAYLVLQRAEITRIVEMVFGARGEIDIERARELIREAYRRYKAQGLPPALRRRLAALARESAERARAEIGLKDPLSGDFDKWVEREFNGLCGRINFANQRELEELLKRCQATGASVPEEFSRKLAAWDGARARALADNAAVRAATAAAMEVYEHGGYETIWVASAGACPICRAMDGRRVTKALPPKHLHCHCTVRAGAKIGDGGADTADKIALRPEQMSAILGIDAMSVVAEAQKKDGRHHGKYLDALTWKESSLEKSIKSCMNTIVEHLEKIRYPELSGVNWDAKSEAEKAGLLKKWNTDARRNTEQLQLYLDILSKKRGDQS